MKDATVVADLAEKLRTQRNALGVLESHGRLEVNPNVRGPESAGGSYAAQPVLRPQHILAIRDVVRGAYLAEIARLERDLASLGVDTEEPADGSR